MHRVNFSWIFGLWLSAARAVKYRRFRSARWTSLYKLKHLSEHFEFLSFWGPVIKCFLWVERAKWETGGTELSNEQRKLAVRNRLENFHELQVDAFNGSFFVFKGLGWNFWMFVYRKICCGWLFHRNINCIQLHRHKFWRSLLDFVFILLRIWLKYNKWVRRHPQMMLAILGFPRVFIMILQHSRYELSSLTRTHPPTFLAAPAFKILTSFSGKFKYDMSTLKGRERCSVDMQFYT